MCQYFYEIALADSYPLIINTRKRQRQKGSLKASPKRVGEQSHPSSEPSVYGQLCLRCSSGQGSLALLPLTSFRASGSASLQRAGSEEGGIVSTPCIKGWKPTARGFAFLHFEALASLPSLHNPLPFPLLFASVLPKFPGVSLHTHFLQKCLQNALCAFFRLCLSSVTYLC